ncbi:hypothetical protein CM240_2774 [Clostridium bornimense]|uniref:DHHW protein n=1 Tax=Clostridium bornimense TaxID=1216932 RepID=W6RZ48_9CLOT|nr:DHHW family protein [Clostridium bornimense]CDM69891.1 hypothetical protein CM240_2774 [Clostridium bornimense]
MKNKNFIVAGVFVVFIFIVSLLNIISPTKIYSEKEKRKLAQSPELNKETIFSGKFTREYEEYFNDQFVFRDNWISLNTKYKILSLNKDINDVYLGKDNYLFEDTSSYDTKKLYKNMDHLKNLIIKYKDSIGENNINIMLIPNGSEILSDKLPKYATVLDQQRILKDAEVMYKDNFINTYDILKRNKSKYIYYKTDHHWTTLGAYYAYNAWADKTNHEIETFSSDNTKIVSTNFLGTIYSKINYAKEPDIITIYNPEEKYSVNYDSNTSSSTSLYNLEYLEKKDQYSVFLDGNHGLVTITSSNTNGKNLLIIKDSYANCFIPFIADEYEKIHVIDLRYYNSSLESYIEDNDISELLVLYNINSIAKDTNLYKVTR